MGFVQNSGNPGLARALEGAAAGFETARRIQDQQQAREMAQQELQMRQGRSDLEFDMFSERLRQNQATEARADLRLTEDIEARKISQTRSQERFDRITASEDREIARDQARGEANSLMLRAMGDDDQINDEELKVLTDSLRDFPPEVQAGLLLKVRGLRAQKTRQEALGEARDLASSENYILNSGLTPEARAALGDELLSVKLLHSDDPEGYAEAVREVQGRILSDNGKRREVTRWGQEAESRIGIVIDDPAEKQEAWMLHQRVLDIGESNPNDPRVAQMQERIEWLSTPKSIRANMEAEREQNVRMQGTLLTLGMADPDQISRLTQSAKVQAQILATGFGDGFARSEEARGVELTAALKAAGMDVNLDVLLPADKALPQQKHFAFQSISTAMQALEGSNLPESVMAQHRKETAERSGIVWDEAMRFEFGDWLANPSMYDLTELDPEKIIAAKLFKKDARDHNRDIIGNARRDAALKWLEAFRANEKAEEGGIEGVPLGPPPAIIEDQARDMGWTSDAEKNAARAEELRREGAPNPAARRGDPRARRNF